MKITDRDIDLLGWILEQKFMTERQVRGVFWNGLQEGSREVFRRLSELRKEGYLTTNKTAVYRNAIYLVTTKGIGQLKRFNRDYGLKPISDQSYSGYGHDLAVTDIRILFHQWGYKHWLSRRVLAKRKDLRRVPDGLILTQDKCIAIEYETSQKSKQHYRQIFLNYTLDSHIHKVLYVVNTPEQAYRVSRQADIYSKPHFVSIQDIQKDLLQAKLKNSSGECSLSDLVK